MLVHYMYCSVSANELVPSDIYNMFQSLITIHIYKLPETTTSYVVVSRNIHVVVYLDYPLSPPSDAAGRSTSCPNVAC